MPTICSRIPRKRTSSRFRLFSAAKQTEERKEDQRRGRRGFAEDAECYCALKARHRFCGLRAASATAALTFFVLTSCRNDEKNNSRRGDFRWRDAACGHACARADFAGGVGQGN